MYLHACSTHPVAQHILYRDLLPNKIMPCSVCVQRVTENELIAKLTEELEKKNTEIEMLTLQIHKVGGTMIVMFSSGQQKTLFLVAHNNSGTYYMLHPYLPAQCACITIKHNYITFSSVIYIFSLVIHFNFHQQLCFNLSKQELCPLDNIIEIDSSLDDDLHVLYLTSYIERNNYCTINAQLLYSPTSCLTIKLLQNSNFSQITLYWYLFQQLGKPSNHNCIATVICLYFIAS